MPIFIGVVRESNSWKSGYSTVGIFDNYDKCWESLQNYKNEKYLKTNLLVESRFRRRKEEFSDYTSEFYNYNYDYWEIEFISLHFEKPGIIENFYDISKTKRIEE